MAVARGSPSSASSCCPSLLSGGSSYHGVNTSDAIAQIQAGNVTKALQKDKEQTSS